MAKLTLPDLLRPKSVEYLKKIVEKIDKKDPFTRVGGEVGNEGDNVYLEFNNVTAEDAFRQRKGLKYKDIPDGEIFRNATKPKEGIRLSGIQKTTELGSGKGSGGGAEATAQTESMCCYFAAYLFNGPLTQFDLSENYEKALKAFFSPKGPGKECVHAYHTTRYTLAKLWKKAPMDKEWMRTYMVTANKIKQKATQFTGYVYFHRGSPFMDSIYEKKKKCEKHNRDLIKSGTPLNYIYEAVSTFSNDKWNPGDIWMSTVNPTKEPFTWKPDFMASGMEKHVCDWPSLQMSVFQSALWGETLGISLKKTGMKESATWQEFNHPGNRKESVGYKGFRFGDGDFFNSTDMYLEIIGASVQYRPTDGTKSWQGEIKGATASGGKAGGGPTNYFAELYFGRSIGIGSTTKKESGTWKEKKGTVTGNDKKEMYKLYLNYNNWQTVNKKTSVKISKEKAKKGNPYEALQDFEMTEQGNNYIYTSTKDIVSESDFITLGDNYISRGKNASANFWFGKYMALAFVDVLHSKGKSSPNQRGFSREVIRYARSNIDNVSSYFWKIS